MMQVWAIIVDSFREAKAKKLFWALLAISTLVAAALSCIGFDENGWSFFFGAIRKPDAIFRAGTDAAASLIGAIVSNVLVGSYIGWVGIVICLIGAAGMFPSLIETGAVDVVVSKPLPRSLLFLARYIGSLAFVFVQSAYFVLLTFLVLRWQLDRWLWGYLWAIPLLVLSFSYIYCVCVLAAVWTRRTLASLVYGLLFWVAVFGMAGLERFVGTNANAKGPEVVLAFSERGSIGKVSYVIHQISPKPGDIPIILGREIGALSSKDMAMAITAGDADLISAGDIRQLDIEQRRFDSISAARSIGSSLAFEAVVLLVAGMIFSRRDF
jgi:ABC-type transport system involved in multi-copper enzyme maturation permease subunit